LVLGLGNVPLPRKRTESHAVKPILTRVPGENWQHEQETRPDKGIPDCKRTKSSAYVEFSFYVRMIRRLIQIAACSIVVPAFFWGGCQWIVLSMATGVVAYPSDNIAHAPVVIVLGASVLANGQPSDILADRLTVAANLYTAGLADKVLVSGDNGQDGYDEVNAMRRYLLAAGVAAEDLFLDHAGFDTYDSMYRARHVFGVTDAIVVTQQYHLSRALYLADAVGMHAQGVSSDLQPYAKQAWFSARESLARVKAVVNVLFGAEPTYFGEPIDLAGDGRTTWDEGISSP